MPINNKCPICNEEMKKYVDILDGHILMEESLTCNSGHYSHEYVHGNTSIQVGSAVIIYGYETPFSELEVIQKALNLLIEEYKRNIL